MSDDPKKENEPSSAEPQLGGAASSAGDETPPVVSGSEDADEESEDEEQDLASPEAILKRVSALDEDDDTERIARAEEAKLAERKRNERKSKKKGGLEAAASKRLAKIGSKAPVKRAIATAVDADPLLERAASLSKWAQKNQQLVSYAVGVAILAGIAAFGYVAYERRREANASVELAKAVGDERGRIGDPDKEDDPDRPHDPRPVFKTIDNRRDAALAAYREVETHFRGTGAAILARLSEGSLLLDKADADGALSAFQDVSGSALAHADVEVRGRALEGMGFAYELKADGKPADAAKPVLEQAAQKYRELENTDALGFKELGMYHQARILQKEGETAQAIEELRKLRERLARPEAEHSFVYLDQAVDDDLRALDPTAVPPKPPQRPGGRGAKGGYDEAQMKQLIEQLQRQAKEKGSLPAPGGGPAGPAAPPGGPK